MTFPVLILGCIPRIIVPVARSLSRQGVPVDVASFPPIRRIPSNAISESRTLTPPHIDNEAFIRQLRSLILERRHDMLIPVDDWMMKAVIGHYDELAALVHVVCPPPRIADRVLDKTATLAVAQRCGILIPRTEVVLNSSQMRDLLGRVPLPWVIKPARKETRKETTKSRVLRNRDGLADWFPMGQQFEAAMLVQEYCPGSGVGIEILLHDGECLAAFQHRRTKEAPVDTGGVSVTAIAESVDQHLLQSSLALLRALEWQGIAMVEYKIDDYGRAVLMEVNGRYWGTISLAIYAGMNFPLYQWKLAHGIKPEIPTAYAVGTKWRWTTGYLQSLYGLSMKARRSTNDRKLLTNYLRDLPGDFSPSVFDATFNLTDPVPSLDSFISILREFVSRRTTTAKRSLRATENQVEVPVA